MAVRCAAPATRLESVPMKTCASHFLDLRGVRYHVREWGDARAPKLFLLHGWADVSASFQFLVDALREPWHVIAPDWRGFGLSARTGSDAFWFPDYLADLDALLRHYSPGQPVFLAGHSMGGNVACLYAGVRPERVAKLVALDGFGLPDRSAEDSPGRLEKWLDQLLSPRGFRSYPDVKAFAARMMQMNPRLDEGRAIFLAGHLTEPDGKGGVRLAAEAAHRNVNPNVYRRREAESCWRRVRAPVLWIVQADPEWRRAVGITDDVYDAARSCFADFTEIAIPDSGHSFHHDQPERTAAAIERFLLA